MELAIGETSGEMLGPDGTGTYGIEGLKDTCGFKKDREGRRGRERKRVEKCQV